MPLGRYTVMDGDGRRMGTEEFRCAPGVAGWRYASEIRTDDPEPHREVVDLVVDADWRPVRTRLDTGAHTLLLEADGARRLVGVRDGESIEIPWGPDTHLDYLSPAYNAVTANRLSRTTEIEVVFLEAYTCAPSMERQRYEDGGVERVRTPVGSFEARRWRYTALSTGWSRDLWVAGDVVIAYDGLFTLESYEPGASGPATIG
jgi:hypothetical protein